MSRPHTLKIEVAAALPPPSAPEVVVLCVYQDGAHLSVYQSEAGADSTPLTRTCGGVLRAVEGALAEGDFDGKEDSILLVHVPTEEGPRRLLLIGMGRISDDDPHAFRRVGATAVRQARAVRALRLSLVVPTCSDQDIVVRALAEGAVLGAYDNGFYQTVEEEEPPALEQVTLVAEEQDWYDARAVVERARIVAESVNWARALSDEPGLSLPPREFARRAAEMAAEFGLKVESLSGAEIRARGMGGLAGVGQGSDEEPALIVVRYEPDGVSDDEELWAFVGKGITFDTGGISIKHGLDMYEMKADMAGGAAVLGALRAVAQLRPRRRLVGVVPAAENMPSGRSIKPGDIVRTLAGHTIEVVDTDAEGRLVLVDGIAYARQLGAARIVDLATLTGSVVVALGTHRTGLFANDDAWAAEVTRAAARAGEPVWRMPVSDDYKQRIESPIADFKNYGGKPDATAAALLLSKFAGETSWVHLDIAGTSWLEDPLPHAPKGSTGTGVRTLVELACGEVES